MPWQFSDEDIRTLRACDDADFDCDESACEEYANALAFARETLYGEEMPF
jgi:hypothetical protein